MRVFAGFDNSDSFQVTSHVDHEFKEDVVICGDGKGADLAIE